MQEIHEAAQTDFTNWQKKAQEHDKAADPAAPPIERSRNRHERRKAASIARKQRVRT